MNGRQLKLEFVLNGVFREHGRSTCFQKHMRAWTTTCLPLMVLIKGVELRRQELYEPVLGGYMYMA